MKMPGECDCEKAAFEAGIKLGALYHQFTGTPISPSNLEAIRRAIEASISSQPYVKSVRVEINGDLVRSSLNVFGYSELRGEMLSVVVEVEYGGCVAIAELKYDEASKYPLMRLVRTDKADVGNRR